MPIASCSQRKYAASVAGGVCGVVAVIVSPRGTLLIYG
jgi:hypothetical protein